MNKILSKNQVLILETFSVGDTFYSSDIKKLFQLGDNGSGGLVSGLYRRGIIEPMFREDTDVLWRRIL